jgi:hypothetical protein
MAFALLAGCIVSDQLTVITLHPDGAADWVRFQANIRSTEAGEKGAEELKRYVQDFDAHRDADHRQIIEAGGQVQEARWLRREEPCANLLVAKFSPAALLAFWTLKGDKGELIARPSFTQDGRRRKFSLTLPVPGDEERQALARPTLEEQRQEAANGVSETRIVVAGGRIVAARGFTIAADRRSALLGATEVRELLRDAREKVEIFLEWELIAD